MMVAKFVAEEGILKGSVFPLVGENEWIIGRDPDVCHLVLEDADTAGLHAKCTRTTEGITIESLSPTHPTEVNGQLIQEATLLQQDDQIKIGGNVFRYDTQGDEDVAPGLESTEALQEPNINYQDTRTMSDIDKPDLGTAGNHDLMDKESEQSPENEDLLEEVLKDEIEKRPPEESEEDPLLEEHDILLPEETIETAEKYIARRQTSSANTEASSSEKENKHDTIFHMDQLPDDQGILAEVNFDLLETGRWLLKVIGGPNTGAEFSMQTSGAYLLGTDPNSCDIVFHDTSVSRQHARINISEEDTLTLEDLKSRNGTLLEGEKIQGRVALPSHTVVSLGTTSFIVFDREGEMQTIISPMLPSIVKALQQEEKKEAPIEQAPLVTTPPEPIKAAEEKPLPKSTVLGTFVLIGLISGLFLVIGLGTIALFRSEPVALEEPVNVEAVLGSALKDFPEVKYSYNQPTGRLLLVGHVLTATDKNQLLYNLQGLPFLKNINDRGIIIDEITTREINSILNRNKAWRGITVQTPKPGQFVLSGYLQTREQAERLSEYVSINFPNLDQLERRVIVEEEVISTIELMLQKIGVRNLQVKINNGEITLSGGLPVGKTAEFNRIIEEAKKVPGVSNIRSFVSELAPEATMVNISDRYRVSGASQQGGVNMSVVINGRILSRGDAIEGMTITSIKPNVIFLEKDGIKYRIDY